MSPQLNEFCSKCGNNWMGCNCENYHPSFKLPEHLTIVPKDTINHLAISKEEAEHLMKYFLDCGYISWEFHEGVHLFINRLNLFLREKK